MSKKDSNNAISVSASKIIQAIESLPFIFKLVVFLGVAFVSGWGSNRYNSGQHDMKHEALAELSELPEEVAEIRGTLNALRTLMVIKNNLVQFTEIPSWQSYQNQLSEDTSVWVVQAPQLFAQSAITHELLKRFDDMTVFPTGKYQIVNLSNFGNSDEKKLIPISDMTQYSVEVFSQKSSDELKNYRLIDSSFWAESTTQVQIGTLYENPEIFGHKGDSWITGFPDEFSIRTVTVHWPPVDD